MLPGRVRRVLEGPSGDVADPQGPHELQAGQPGQAVRVPVAKLRVLRLLADDRVLDQRIAEVVNHSRNGKRAAEPLIEGLLAHR